MDKEKIETRQCTYKGEMYSVRSTGEVLRHPKNGRVRPNDDVWTTGRDDVQHGYKTLAGVPVHRIVATAFLGEAPGKDYVVDHIDTNRKNNRPENLRWVTRLENILLNPITKKRIELVCGSVEAFLENPSKYRDMFPEQNLAWMCSVTMEEAQKCKQRLHDWAMSDINPNGRKLGKWIFEDREKTEEKKAEISEEARKYEDKKENKNTEDKIKNKKTAVKKSNPFGFPRNNEFSEAKLYKKSAEIDEQIIFQLKKMRTLYLPEASFAQNKIVVEEAYSISIKSIEEWKKVNDRNCKVIIIANENINIALLIKHKQCENFEIVDSLISQGLNIVEIDLAWAKEGLCEEEIEYILFQDITKKKWLYHSGLNEAYKTILTISEPIEEAKGGVVHSYVKCPIDPDGKEEFECLYCQFNTVSMENNNPEKALCYGKSGVKTYEDLKSIVGVKKENNKIVSISYQQAGSIIERQYDKEIKTRGKTLIQLWEENDRSKLVAHNIYSEWYVLIETSPLTQLREKGVVYGKLSKNKDDILYKQMTKIYNYDECFWEK